MAGTQVSRGVGRGVTAVLALLFGVVLGTAGCVPRPEPIDVVALKTVAASCPRTAVVRVVRDDVSRSGQSDTVRASRDEALTRIVTAAVVCGGPLRITAFTGGPGATATLLDKNDLTSKAATEIARLRKTPETVAEVMQTVHTGLDQAQKQLPQNGSDVVGQFRLAGEEGVQRGAGRGSELEVTVLTDGEQHAAGLKLTRKLMKTSADGVRLARTVPVSPLPPGTRVRLIGVGRTASGTAPTGYVDALKAFYAEIGRRAAAAETVVVTG